ncbi:uncharacterized protein LOC125657139 isoform X2 [Ostrea edulis]|uniref:uncharacterized protein LOC125657139 isoform X2 n=1 Tax=Ostrea edulis TaxID=37623 RepID=UPI0024AF583F|nr:uncharacterized protein LOC125657139 isoform X2 [Ostrea edulis]
MNRVLVLSMLVFVAAAQSSERLPCNLEVYDNDEDGEVSQEEFLAVAQSHGRTEDDLVQKTFAIADTDGDGFLTTDEFERNAASLFAAGIVQKCTRSNKNWTNH